MSRTEEKRAVVLGIEHIGVATGNLDETVRFFGDLLGGQIRDRWRLEEKKIDFVLMEFAGTYLEIIHFEQGLTTPSEPDFPPKRNGLKHVCFAVQDIEQMRSRLEGAGIPMLTQVREGHHYRKQLFCQGPDQSVIELVERR
jgi:catechol 2,3-dioxygenase-like lactoylglutathione lyase family enzyme